MSKMDDALVAVHDPRSPAAEAYRALRTNLQFAGLDRPIRSLLVTSVGGQEDKSAVAANLAVAFAQGGHRVALVDGDLRRPRQHVLFGVDAEPGLTSLVLGTTGDWTGQETAVPSLRLIPAGAAPPNPADLLGSQRLGDVIEALRQGTDLLLFDSPPVLAVADAAILARRVDGVLLVIRAGRTKRDQAAKARVLLERVKANVLGAVLTDARVEAGLHRYYGA